MTRYRFASWRVETVERRTSSLHGHIAQPRIDTPQAFGQPIRFLGGPPELLLQPSKLRLHFDGNDESRQSIGQNQIDDTTRRLGDRDFDLGHPPTVELA